MDIELTSQFKEWLSSIRDPRDKSRIMRRLDRIRTSGHFGDAKQLNEKVCELRLFFGPGYRIYYTWRGETIVLLLHAGDKSTQSKDVEEATRIAEEIDS